MLQLMCDSVQHAQKWVILTLKPFALFSQATHFEDGYQPLLYANF